MQQEVCVELRISCVEASCGTVAERDMRGTAFVSLLKAYSSVELRESVSQETGQTAGKSLGAENLSFGNG